MRTTLILLGLLAFPLCSSADQQSLEGTYHWTDADARGTLQAELESTGTDAWTIAFKFRFNGQDHVYRGTATGSLDGGDFSGTVETENQSRTFRFAGRFVDGAFSGTHAEIRRGGRESKTGTLTLRR